MSCVISTRRTLNDSLMPMLSVTGWDQNLPATLAASTYMSAVSNMPCCTCSTHASGTRFYSTSDMFQAKNRFINFSTRDTFRRTRIATRAGKLYLRAMLSKTTENTRLKAKQSLANTARWERVLKISSRLTKCMKNLALILFGCTK